MDPDDLLERLRAIAGEQGPPAEPPRRRRCSPGAHDDRPLRGSTRVRCARCGDEFPCHHACGHLDCIVATGRALPEWVGLDAREAIQAELQARRLA